MDHKVLLAIVIVVAVFIVIAVIMFKRKRGIKLRSLPADEQERFAAEWSGIQCRFFEHPSVAVRQADSLANEVMGARGFPFNDLKQRGAEVSVNHPGVVGDYRAARYILDRQHRDQLSTEDLRQAMAHYQSIVQALLNRNI